MTKKAPKISDSESIIMNIIWNNEPINSNDIISLVDSNKDWSPKTIKTLINRLLKKEVISYEKKGRTYFYYSLFSIDEYKTQENKSFLKRVYNNSVDAMMLNFIKDFNMTKDEIDSLKQLLEEENK